MQIFQDRTTAMQKSSILLLPQGINPEPDLQINKTQKGNCCKGRRKTNSAWKKMLDFFLSKAKTCLRRHQCNRVRSGRGGEVRRTAPSRCAKADRPENSGCRDTTAWSRRDVGASEKC